MHTPRTTPRLYSALVPKNCLILDLATSAEKKGTKSVSNAVSDVCFDENFYTTVRAANIFRYGVLYATVVKSYSSYVPIDIKIWIPI